MTRREIIEALLAGKVCQYYRGVDSLATCYWRWSEDCGFECTYDKPTVSSVRWRESVLEGANEIERWSLYVEPNPHSAGTYFWAREEFLRGITVRSKRTGVCYNHAEDDRAAAEARWARFTFTHAEFICRDWEWSKE